MSWPADKFGAVRPSALRYAGYYGLATGIGYGMVQRASFMAGDLPAFEESERKKGEALHQQQLNKKDGIIAELKAKLETYSPPQIGIPNIPRSPPSVSHLLVVGGQAKGFHLQDLENDEGIDRWVNYLSDSVDLPMEDSSLDTAFAQ